MISYVIVHIGGGKIQRIQTMPNMLLRQVVHTVSSSHFSIALQLGAKSKEAISLAASTSLREALFVLEHATKGYHKSTKCADTFLSLTSSTLRRRLAKSERASPKYVPFHRSLESSTIVVSADLESGTGVFRVLMPHLNAGFDHFMPDYDDKDDVNINERSGIWDFDIATLQSSSPSTTRSSTSPTFTTLSFSNSNNDSTSLPPTKPTFFTSAPIPQPNTDKPLSGNVSIPTPYIMPVPSLTPRAGVVAPVCRDGHLPSNGNGGNGSDGESNRQTPTQDISAAMIEANQEIRQRLEQQTQEALTDRVRCLSKNSDSSSDKDRFLRSMHGSPTSKKNQQDDIVRQIALRVSRMLKEAEERGEAALDYQTLIAQEIAKEQQAGMLTL
ncbi:hypothetical protein BKA57DRAFT_516541 [Linnemannia elongata]|nr:hypothetical protein BKA57DRAFT_516541 [Linnemannia elongata]